MSSKTSNTQNLHDIPSSFAIEKIRLAPANYSIVSNRWRKNSANCYCIIKTI